MDVLRRKLWIFDAVGAVISGLGVVFFSLCIVGALEDPDLASGSKPQAAILAAAFLAIFAAWGAWCLARLLGRLP